MRMIVQRVQRAAVEIDKKLFSCIEQGLLVFVGVEEADLEEDMQWMATKVKNMRIFSDEDGKMNRSVKEIDGEILLVSQFTLHASTQKGNRPSFIKAAKPEYAKSLYEKLIVHWQPIFKEKLKTGQFGANMQITLLNDGPVTIFIDSKNRE